LKLIEYPDEKREEEQWLEVKKILHHRGDPGQREYLVSWKKSKDIDWVSEESFDSKECIRDYWK